MFSSSNRKNVSKKTIKVERFSNQKGIKAFFRFINHLKDCVRRGMSHYEIHYLYFRFTYSKHRKKTDRNCRGLVLLLITDLLLAWFWRMWTTEARRWSKPKGFSLIQWGQYLELRNYSESINWRCLANYLAFSEFFSQLPYVQCP